MKQRATFLAAAVGLLLGLPFGCHKAEPARTSSQEPDDAGALSDDGGTNLDDAGASPDGGAGTDDGGLGADSGSASNDGGDAGCSCPGCPGCPCSPGDAPVPCGRNGACVQSCTGGGGLGACLPPGASSIDTDGDAANCGECGNPCPTPLRAPAACRRGACGRGPCERGYFDIDGPTTFGCESTCAGKVCTLPGGGQVTLDSLPPPETGVARHSFSSGSSLGAAVQTSATHTNMGVLGSAVTSGSGAVQPTSSSHKNIGALISAKH